jgi:hypothetical protein
MIDQNGRIPVLTSAPAKSYYLHQILSFVISRLLSGLFPII